MKNPVLRSVKLLAISIVFGVALGTVPDPVRGGEVRYAYDARGRLAAVTAEDGVTYAYNYDQGGNLLSVRITPVLITEVTPSEGQAGDPVTLDGIGFDGGSIVVRFNGTQATVTNTTATQIETSVPAGASSGPITVQTANGTATSLVDFQVVGGPAAITDFTPKTGAAGTSVSITGSGFDDQEEGNAVTLNGVLANVTTASPASVSFSVPSGVGSGKIRLETSQPPAVTTIQDFLVAPPGYLPSAVERGVRGNLGTPVTVALSQAGKISLLLFEAQAGLRLGVALGADGGLCTTELLVRPDNTIYGSDPADVNTHCGVAFKEPVTLDQAGTWTLALDPNGATTGTRNVTLSEVPDNPSVSMLFQNTGDTEALTTTVSGQNARFTFQAAAGDSMSFIASVTDSNPRQALTWRILKPNGSELDSDATASASIFHDRTLLDTAGIWTIVGDEDDTSAVHTYQLVLYKVPPDFSVSVPTNNTVVLNLNSTPGQNARFTFNIGFSTGTIDFTGAFRVKTGPLSCSTSLDSTTGGRTWRVYRPNGTLVQQYTNVASSFSPSAFNTGALPFGTWTIEADETGQYLHCFALSVLFTP